MRKQKMFFPAAALAAQQQLASGTKNYSGIYFIFARKLF